MARMARYSSSLTAAAHGQVETPSWAGAHGAGSGLRGGRREHRRNGTADSMASATCLAALVDGSGPR